MNSILAHKSFDEFCAAMQIAILMQHAMERPLTVIGTEMGMDKNRNTLSQIRASAAAFLMAFSS